MNQQVNKTLIGGFVIAALALAFAGVMVFGSGKLFKATHRYVCYFQESVKGLSVGAPVVFEGVAIGSVLDVSLIGDTDDLTFKIPVTIEVVEDSIQIEGKTIERGDKEIMNLLIERGLRARLQSQSMVTGQLMIEMAFHPDKPAERVGTDPTLVEIPTIPSTMESLAQSLKNLHLDELTHNLSSTVEGLDRIINSSYVTDGLQALHDTIADLRELVNNIDGRIGTMADGIEATIEDSRDLIRHADRQVGILGTTAKATLEDTRTLIGNANERIGPLAVHMNETLDDAQRLMGNVSAQVKPLSERMQETARSARKAFVQAEATFKTLEGTLGKDSPVMHQVTRTLEELSGAARSIRIWAEYLERHPEALVQGKK